ncbi:MAG: RNA methyltransferase substrate-binding domain-containing protein, partial [Gammaproteobacteria bacterium]
MAYPESLSPAAVLERVRRLGSRRERDGTGRHYVEGLRAVMEAFTAAIPVDVVVYSEVLCRNPLLQKLVRLKKREGVPVLRVTPGQFRSVSTT